MSRKLPRHNVAGFTLIELMVACMLAALLTTLAWPIFRGHASRIGRLDAVESLNRIQLEQEKYRQAHGLYAAELSTLKGLSTHTVQGRYLLSLRLDGPEAYLASAQATGAQAQDPGCATITLQVRQGFAQVGPHAGCWQR